MNQRVIRDITDFIFMKDEPQKSDVIFIPGTSQSAVTETAARLYCAGYAGYVLPSGMYSGKRGKFASEKIDKARYAGEYDTDWAYCKHILLANGVPESAILREDRSTHTGENAEYSARVFEGAGDQGRKSHPLLPGVPRPQGIYDLRKVLSRYGDPGRPDGNAGNKKGRLVFAGKQLSQGHERSL